MGCLLFLVISDRNIPPCTQEISNKPVELGIAEGESESVTPI